jgi:4-alpha-glucanotransferase
LEGKKMERRSGILLHITSLPSPYGIGDLGPWAYKFVDFLARAKQSFWQILPLTPTALGAAASSPYHGLSSFAGNTLLISPTLMLREGLLDEKDIKSPPRFSKNRVNYSKVTSYKRKLFSKAYEKFRETGRKNQKYEKFCSENSGWLDDFSLFIALKNHFSQRNWSEWPAKVRDRQPEALQTFKKLLRDEIEKEKFLQYIFFKQWFSLKRYCREKGIEIIGDLPFYVNYDSADVWTNPEMFKLNKRKRPTFVAGVPPDYFSRTGQLWGNPIYRWGLLKRKGYPWWIKRIEHNLKLYDWIRIDHFRGFVGYWQVRAGRRTARKGCWIKGHADDFFTKLRKRFRRLPIIAEDLGTITRDVREVMRKFGFPGMRVLLFAFNVDPSKNHHAPHNYVKNCMVVTGTHDLNPVRGWFEKEASPKIKKRLFRYLGRKVSGEEIHLEFIRLGMMSVADMAIFPMQDILGLGEEARMNTPATMEGNWEWRLLPKQLTPSLARRLAEITKVYGRAKTTKRRRRK